MRIQNVMGWLNLFILVVTLPVDANAKVVDGELRPATGLFSWLQLPSPYHLVLREKLIGERGYRKCQIVALPSRGNTEWATYMIRKEGESRLVVKRMTKHLSREMSRVISNSPSLSYVERQSEALSMLPKESESFSMAIPGDTANAMEKAWEMVLARVRYRGRLSSGFGGTMYHVFHFGKMTGPRSGTTWSPKEGTLPGDLIAIGEYIRASLSGDGYDEEKVASHIYNMAQDLVNKIESINVIERR